MKGLIINNVIPMALATIDDSAKLLVEYQTMFRDRLRKGDREEDDSAIMLAMAFKFGKKTMDAIRCLLQEGHEALFACTLCRSFHEMAIRMLWASTHSDDGWPRLEVYYKDETRKWAEEAVTIPGLADSANYHLQDSQEYLSRAKKPEPQTKLPPKLKQMLREIESRYIQDGLGINCGAFAKLPYTAIYRTLSRATHAHMGELGAAQCFPLMEIMPFGVIGAVWMMLMSYSYDTDDPRHEIQVASAKIRDIMSAVRRRHIT